MKHFLTLKDLTRAEIIKLLDSSIQFKALKKDNITHNYLAGKSNLFVTDDKLLV